MSQKYPGEKGKIPANLILMFYFYLLEEVAQQSGTLFCIYVFVIELHICYRNLYIQLHCIFIKNDVITFRQ